MKITRKLASSIKASCRKVCGGRRKVEVGERSWPDKADDVNGLNFLLWGDGHDLLDVVAIDALIGHEAADYHGWVALDCYCYHPSRGEYEGGDLDCNVYVLLRPDGTVAYASEDDMRHERAINEILAAHGVPAFVDVD